ncbi:hypothetical protein SDC9_177494 [bioreactor metagenome]|uniref:GGDEF domain-containing protein n=1 Tax=bioreactor metagenome TaxID=1076179 RepID=A0A645GT03_9ZZZZ
MGERTRTDQIQTLVETIHKNVLDYNQSGRANYTLMISMGYAIFKEGDTEDTFLAAADKAMYCNKLQNKAALYGYQTQSNGTPTSVHS